MFETSDRVRLRYATFPKGAGAAKGTICLVGGRTEFIEKYFETIADFQARGFAVATFDWRGQGGSRPADPQPDARLCEATSTTTGRDLKSFHGSILLPDCPAPYYLVGHSMGGLVSLYAGARDRMMFERMFLSAPMVGLDGQPFGVAGMARLGKVLTALGLGRLPIGRKRDKAQTEQSFAGNPLTSDLVRFMRSSRGAEGAAGPASSASRRSAGRRRRFEAMAGAAHDQFPGHGEDPGADAGGGAGRDRLDQRDRAAGPADADRPARGDPRRRGTKCSWKPTRSAARCSRRSMRSSRSSRGRGRA